MYNVTRVVDSFATEDDEGELYGSDSTVINGILFYGDTLGGGTAAAGTKSTARAGGVAANAYENLVSVMGMLLADEPRGTTGRFMWRHI